MILLQFAVIFVTIINCCDSSDRVQNNDIAIKNIVNNAIDMRVDSDKHRVKRQVFQDNPNCPTNHYWRGSTCKKCSKNSRHPKCRPNQAKRTIREVNDFVINLTINAPKNQDGADGIDTNNNKVKRKIGWSEPCPVGQWKTRRGLCRRCKRNSQRKECKKQMAELDVENVVVNVIVNKAENKDEDFNWQSIDHEGREKVYDTKKYDHKVIEGMRSHDGCPFGEWRTESGHCKPCEGYSHPNCEVLNFGLSSNIEENISKPAD